MDPAGPATNPLIKMAKRNPWSSRSSRSMA